MLEEESLSKLKLINHIFEVLVFWDLSIIECVGLLKYKSFITVGAYSWKARLGTMQKKGISMG